MEIRIVFITLYLYLFFTYIYIVNILRINKYEIKMESIFIIIVNALVMYFYLINKGQHCINLLFIFNVLCYLFL